MNPYTHLLIGFVLGSGVLWIVSRIFDDLIEWAEGSPRKRAQRTESEFVVEKPREGRKPSKKQPAYPPIEPPKIIPLHESQGFRALFEAFYGGAATLDDEGRILGTNSPLRERLGYSESSLHGQPLANFVHPEDVNVIHGFFKSLHDGSRAPGEKPHLSRELRCFDNKGAVLWLQLALSVLPTEEQPVIESETITTNGSVTDANAARPAFTPATILALVTDVTRRRQAESAAARLAAGVHDLYQVVADRQLNLSEQMQASLSLGCHLFNLSTGVLTRSGDQQIEIAAVVSPDERLRVGRVYDLSPGAAPQRPTLPKPIACGTAFNWKDTPVLATTSGETFLGAPIFIAGKQYGVLYFYEADSREAPFENEQIQFCQLMALWVGSEIERHLRQTEQARRGADLAKANSRLEAMATEDALTGVKNRRAFDDRLQTEWKKAARTGHAFSILLMDVDKFKQYNDSFGHPAGDEVLKQVGRILRTNVRDGVFVGRYGGEEFVVLMPETDEEGALATGERLRAGIENASWQHRAVTASFGAATSNSNFKAPEELVQAADGALYISKTEGRNRVTAAPTTPA